MDPIKVTNEKLNELIEKLESEKIYEEDVKKLKYLSEGYFEEIMEKRYEAIEEADILSGENDTYARSEYESLRQEIRNYDMLLQNEMKLKRIGYEVFLKYVCK